MGIAAASGLVLDMLAGAVKAAGVASGSRHFRNAVGALAEGDLPGAERQLFGGNAGNIGGDNCFVAEVSDQVDPKAAAQFTEAWNAAVDAAFASSGQYLNMPYESGEMPDPSESPILY